eukprot:2910484-Karenia_brevis.AAC.1
MSKRVISKECNMGTIYLEGVERLESKEGKGIVEEGEEGGEGLRYMVPKGITLPQMLQRVLALVAKYAESTGGLDTAS